MKNSEDILFMVSSWIISIGVIVLIHVSIFNQYMWSRDFGDVSLSFCKYGICLNVERYLELYSGHSFYMGWKFLFIPFVIGILVTILFTKWKFVKRVLVRFL